MRSRRDSDPEADDPRTRPAVGLSTVTTSPTGRRPRRSHNAGPASGARRRSCACA